MASKSPVKKATELPAKEQVFQVMFDRIAEKGFGKTRISDLAESFRVPLATFYATYPSIESIMERFLDYIDQRMVDEISSDGVTKRDVYFDLLMSRFDTLQEFGPGVKIWLRDLVKQPLQLVTLLVRWERTLSLMLDIAKDSPVFPMKKIGLGLIYVSTLRQWIKDDSESMDKTMVAIDQALSKAEDFTSRFMTRKPASGKA